MRQNRLKQLEHRNGIKISAYYALVQFYSVMALPARKCKSVATHFRVAVFKLRAKEVLLRF